MTPDGVSAGRLTLDFGRFAPLMAAPSCITTATPATNTGAVSQLPAASQVIRPQGRWGDYMHVLMRASPQCFIYVDFCTLVNPACDSYCILLLSTISPLFHMCMWQKQY
jgi:hypothetical protein